MTNYNERLDEVLLGVAIRGAGKKQDDDYVSEAKQAITSLIKELVAEAKPAHGELGSERQRILNAGKNIVIDQFEQNLIKALEGKK